jgi:hypothetical protein
MVFGYAVTTEAVGKQGTFNDDLGVPRQTRQAFERLTAVAILIEHIADSACVITCGRDMTDLTWKLAVSDEVTMRRTRSHTDILFNPLY